MRSAKGGAIMALLDVISYRGTNDILIHRHERTEFTTLSQLTVHESQEAVLFLEGKKLDTLPPGRHTMHTKNIPLLNKLVNLPLRCSSTRIATLS